MALSGLVLVVAACAAHPFFIKSPVYHVLLIVKGKFISKKIEGFGFIQQSKLIPKILVCRGIQNIDEYQISRPIEAFTLSHSSFWIMVGLVSINAVAFTLKSLSTRIYSIFNFLNRICVH
jgi:hypothetical protein